MTPVLPRRTALKSLTLAALALTGVTALSACSSEKGTSFRSVDITGANYGKNFKLTDFDGKTRQLSDFKGKVVLMFFGYTQCPDVCPTTLGEMAQVKQALGSDGDQLQVLFVSVDPERDTPEMLKAYMQGFDPDFLGLYTDSPDELAALAKDFKVYYKRVDGTDPKYYTIDHTAASFIYDPKGRLRLYSRYGTSIADTKADIEALINGA